jgi:hypothetical protein
MEHIRGRLESIRDGFSASSSPRAAPADVLQNSIPVQFSDEQIVSLSTAFSRDVTGSSNVTPQMSAFIMSQSSDLLGRKHESGAPPASAPPHADSVRE